MKRSFRTGILLLTAGICIALFAFLGPRPPFLTAMTYGGQKVLSVKEGPPIIIWIETHVGKHGLSGGLGFQTEQLPFSLRIEAYSTTNRYDAMSIHEAKVQYPDGSVDFLISASNLWRRQFASYTNATSSSRGVEYREEFRLREYIENAVKRASPFTLTLRGDYVDRHGTHIPFEASHEFGTEREWAVGNGIHE